VQIVDKAASLCGRDAALRSTRTLDVQDIVSPTAKLEQALSDTSGVYVNVGVNARAYFAGLVADIRKHMCEPFPVSAAVLPPGFPDADVGSRISGQCVAHSDGYWLVYQPEQDRFYCFWGTDPSNLGARGVVGSPLYCWSA
jgi:hypothetical protein